MKTQTTFTPEEIEVFAPAEKIGLLACHDPHGETHVTLITSLMAAGPTQLTIGQFCRGRSKWYIQRDPRVAFLIMSLDRRLWRGTAHWTHRRCEGPEYEIYNAMPMFRYNAYFGINTVHYFDLVAHGGREALPMGRIVPAALMTRCAKGGAGTGQAQRILKPFAENLFNRLDALKFIACPGDDGFPRIVPLIQCQAADSRRLVFSTYAYKEELAHLIPGATVAVYALNLRMQSVLVRGTFAGFGRVRGLTVGTIDLNWVYNSMPPCHDQIYPPVALEPVVDF